MKIFGKSWKCSENPEHVGKILKCWDNHEHVVGKSENVRMNLTM